MPVTTKELIDSRMISAPVQTITHFCGPEPQFRPTTSFSVVQMGRSLIVNFSVHDRAVRCRYGNDQDPVYEDSCVEMFIQPAGVQGYFNVEMNAAGTLLMWYITDPHRGADGSFAGANPVPSALLSRIVRSTSLGREVPIEIEQEVEWYVAYMLPFSILEEMSRTEIDLTAEPWRGNFYKCGDKTTNPHWASWSPVPGTAPNFHQPQYFGTLHFAEPSGAITGY